MNKLTQASKIKAVAFDLDHTLFDRYATLKLVSHDFFTEKREWLSQDMTEEKVADILIRADAVHIVQGWSAIHKYWMDSGLLANDKDGNPIADKKELFDYVWNYGFFKHAVKYPFTNPMLDELREAGYKVCLITNCAKEIGIRRQTAKLELLDMTDKFDEIIISGQVGIHKPHRNIFDIMSWRLGIPAQNMLYVGDHPINDVEGSKAAGYIPVWVRLREEYGESADCEYSVKDVSEIPALADRINSEQ
ncbi:MAG: HAD family hydrolase [Ruminococcaceae bacterium]|nr:HAD family hydrolase [Oscillospiraceae bacterium]